jgi:hypothetical protein
MNNLKEVDAIIAEAARYEKCYENPAYKMCGSRFERAKQDTPPGTGYALDISCGRGEWLDYLDQCGWNVQGTETVDALVKPPRIIKGYLPEIPLYGKYDFVSCLDVLEHLIPEQTDASLANIRALGYGKWLIAVATVPDIEPGIGELHINLRTSAEWDALIVKHFTEFKIKPTYTDMNIQYRIGY